MNFLQAGGWPFAVTGLTSAWANFPLPFLDIPALIETQHKNAAALRSVSQVVFDGMRMVAQHQADFFQTPIGDYRKAACDLMANRSVEEGPSMYSDAIRRVYLSSVGHLRELADIAINTNVSAVEILNSRITEAFDEAKAMLAAPLTLGDGAPTEIIGEQIAIAEPVAPARDVEVKPEPTKKSPKQRKAAAPAAKAARHRPSRR